MTMETIHLTVELAFMMMILSVETSSIQNDGKECLLSFDTQNVTESYSK